ncbi:MAG: hypothetical protein H7Y38_15160, partial [Armatimonadetes bacterium]|nr:hypothetical protein [Armatimonadota bacterium]
MKRTAFLLSLIAVSTCVAGCSPETMENVRKDTERNVEIAEREGGKVEKKLRPAITEAKKQVAPSLKKLD